MQVLKFNLTESGLFAVLPWLTMAVTANVGGWIADSLVRRGTSVTVVRKVLLIFIDVIAISIPFFFLFSNDPCENNFS